MAVSGNMDIDVMDIGMALTDLAVLVSDQNMIGIRYIDGRST